MSFVPSYILILGFTIVIDFLAAICIEGADNKSIRKLLLVMSLFANIGVLVFFKYFNFFNNTIDVILGHSGRHTPFPYLGFLLPIGLSFHTFQAMSYTIEVYRGNHKAERHFGIYALYVMFYPQLVAGPIERPQNILWQFHLDQKYNFESLKAGLMQMAFGLFKKVVIADRIAEIVDKAYANPGGQNGKTLLIVSILYSFQIYCDFSGYCDIGIGAAKTMGFKLIDNFNLPYVSQSLSEFWKRWHISLSTWFRDYLYIPLGGSRVKSFRKAINLMIVFLISGLWHGANWTFIIWGALNGMLLIIENTLTGFSNKMRERSHIPAIIRLIKVVTVFIIVTLLWIFFRSPSLSDAKDIFQRIFSMSIFSSFNYTIAKKPVLIFCFLLIIILLLKERFWLRIPTKDTRLFYIVFSFILMACYVFGIFSNHTFIYFQF